MKRKTAIFLAVLFCAVALMPSCGNETPEESITYRDISELTTASESPAETETGAATEGSGNDAGTESDTDAETETTAETVTEEPFSSFPDDIAVPADPVAPASFDDHGEQLRALGFEEGTFDYDLYDALFDLSCKVYYYISVNLKWTNGPYLHCYYAKHYHYYKYEQEIRGIVSALMTEFNVSFPDVSLLPPELYLRDAPPRKSDDYKEYEKEQMEKYLAELVIIRGLFSDIRDRFTSAPLGDCGYAAEMLRYIDLTEEEMAISDSYLEDPLRDNFFEWTEEYDAALGMIRVTAYTDCVVPNREFFDSEGNVEYISALGPYATQESSVEHGDGTRTVTWLVTWDKVRSWKIGNDLRPDDPQTFLVENKLGWSCETPYLTRFPDAFVNDEPCRVEHEQLHKTLQALFMEIKGSGTYTNLDLAYIRIIQVTQQIPNSSDPLFRSGNCITVMLYESLLINAEDRYPNIKVFIGRGLYRMAFPDEIPPISESDLALMFYPEYRVY